MATEIRQSHVPAAEHTLLSWPENELEHVTHCPVCGSATRTTLHEGLTDRVFFCAPGTWTLYSCTGCGSAYLDPRPTSASIGRTYGEYFTHVGNDPSSVEGLSMPRRIRRALANGYRNWRFGTQLAPASSAGVIAAWLLPSLRTGLDAGLRYLPKAFPGACVLDVGAGNGDFLVAARSAGWTVVGVEPDPKAIAVCRRCGLDVKQGGIEQFDGQHACFDYITISHVIEHVHDPRGVLLRAFELLKPGGTLYVDTPNIAAYGHKRFGSCCLHLDPPRHLVLFNWESLETLLRQVGFRAVTYKPRPVYAAMASSSKAIRAGKRPLEATPSFTDRIVGQVRAAKLVISHGNSEFVTLLARKQATDDGA